MTVFDSKNGGICLRSFFTSEKDYLTYRYRRHLSENARTVRKESQGCLCPQNRRSTSKCNMPQNIYTYKPGMSVPKNVRHVKISRRITKIRNRIFKNRSALQSITIPDSVTEIGANAFEGCSGLQSVTIPDSVTKIETGAFEGCSGLQSVSMPNSITEIGKYAFKRCSGLRSITIPDSITEMEAGVFEGCSGLQSVTIPDRVTKIGIGAFYDCSALRSVTIPDSVAEIAPAAFYRCAGLRSITIPDGVTEIKGNTFSGCSDLQSITIPDSVTVIDDSAFAYCCNLRSVAIPDSVKEIGEFAFRDCSDLQSITIPDGVTHIGHGAFSGCSALRTVTIPDSVTEIGDYAFSGCSGLQSITIPDGITKIRECAFCGCSNLQSITIPDSVKEIGPSAFKKCSGLQSVTIPDSVTKISGYAFSGCSGLRSITIPDGVTEINYGAFENCTGLRSIAIPDGVTHIGSSAFSKCSDLQSVIIPDGITEIGENTFQECANLQSVTVPDSVTKIRYSAFSGCSGLQSIAVPDSVTKIESGAFCNCSALQSFTIPDSVTKIGDHTFAGCPSLQSLTYKGINIARFINIDGYGVNTFDIIKVLIEHGIPLYENTVKFGIDMEHRDEMPQWIREYPTFGTMRLPEAAKSVDGRIKERLQRCFASQKRTKGHVPEILDKLAITVRVCGIPPERLAETFDIEYTKSLLGKQIPLVPAEACRCYYDRNTCAMLIRKSRIAVMTEAISLYNKSEHRECYRYLMDFIRSHPDIKTEDLLYAVDHAEEIPMKEGTTLTQIRQHRTYMESRAEVAKIEVKYGNLIPGFRLSAYPCNLEQTGIVYDGMTARMLDLSDSEDIALAARLGELTNCCQRLDAAGETAMMHGFMNPDAGFWVIEDTNGTVKAQAEVWKSGPDVLVFDNIEFANTDNEHLSDRVEQLRGMIAAWAIESGYENIIMGCGYNELETEAMEQAPIPELHLTPEEVFVLQKDNDEYVFFDDIDAVREYMQTWRYDPCDFVYTDADEQCVYIKKDGVVSDYLMRGYDRGLTKEYPSFGRNTIKEQSGDIACK